MNQFQIDQFVQIVQDLPEQELHSGEVGVVCSQWFAPYTVYEVEFQPSQTLGSVRALLTPSQIKVIPQVRNHSAQENDLESATERLSLQHLFDHLRESNHE